MSQSVKLPDPLYQDAKETADAEDTSIGAIIREWRAKSQAFDHRHRHRLADAEPTTIPEDAPRDENNDPEER